jgi:cytochrome c biogenesis protein CcdA
MNDFRLKMIFGFSILLVLAVLAAIIAVGKVEQDTSFGLQIVLGALAVLSGGFAQWAFGHEGKDKGE